MTINDVAAMAAQVAQDHDLQIRALVNALRDLAWGEDAGLPPWKAMARAERVLAGFVHIPYEREVEETSAVPPGEEQPF